MSRGLSFRSDIKTRAYAHLYLLDYSVYEYISKICPFIWLLYLFRNLTVNENFNISNKWNFGFIEFLVIKKKAYKIKIFNKIKMFINQWFPMILCKSLRLSEKSSRKKSRFKYVKLDTCQGFNFLQWLYFDLLKINNSKWSR